ncbi:MAG: hypothetical protein ABGW87_07660 [Sphingomonadaceae bacterium]
MSDRIGAGARVKVDLPAVLVDSAGNNFACKLIDLSSEGFRAKLEEHVGLRSFEQLINGPQEYEIGVRWTSGGELGGLIIREAFKSNMIA